MAESMRPFAGQTVAITGAGNGLGREYALLLSRLGASVVVNDLGTRPDGFGVDASVAEAVVDEIRRGGGQAIACSDDVATPSGGRAVVDAALDTYGRIDAVISNAGSLRSAPFEDTTDENLNAMIDVHLKGAFNIGRPAFRAMKSQGYGRLLFTASSGGLFGSEGNAAYGAAKTGLIGLTNVTAIEGRDHGIQSNLLLPVSTTRLQAEGVPSYLLRIQAALRTMGPDRPAAIGPQFVAPLAAYLVSRDCASTHAIYTAALGRYARVFIGLSEGWIGPSQSPPDVEDIAAHFGRIAAPEPFVIPQHLAEEFEEMARLLSRPTEAESPDKGLPTTAS